VFVTDVRLTGLGSPISPDLIWTGSNYAITWIAGQSSLGFTQFTSSGEKIGEDIFISPAAPGFRRPLVWTGSHFAIAWVQQNVGIFLVRLNPDGTRAGNDILLVDGVMVDPNFSSVPLLSLTWNGTEFAIFWPNTSLQYQFFFTRANVLGEKIGNDVPVLDGGVISVFPFHVWTGSEYGITWRDERTGTPEVFFSRVSVTGSKIGDDFQVSDASTPSSNLIPNPVWTGSGFGVAWRDERHGQSEIYFSRLACNCFDEDLAQIHG